MYLNFNECVVIQNQNEIKRIKWICGVIHILYYTHIIIGISKKPDRSIESIDVQRTL